MWHRDLQLDTEKAQAIGEVDCGVYSLLFLELASSSIPLIDRMLMR